MDEMRVEIEQLKISLHKQQDVQQDNQRLQHEVNKLQAFISEQETSLEGHRERIRESERTIAQHLEQTRILEALSDKLRQESLDLKRSLLA